MFNFNLLTGPLFTAGVLNGFNKRAEPSFHHDPYAHYKLGGITLLTTCGMSLNEYFKEHFPTKKSSFSSHMIGGGIGGGLLVSGSAYCIGLMLTKIPSKKVFE